MSLGNMIRVVITTTGQSSKIGQTSVTDQFGVSQSNVVVAIAWSREALSRTTAAFQPIAASQLLLTFVKTALS